MFRSIIHCLNGVSDRDNIINDNINSELIINIKNIHAVDLINNDQAIHNNFLAQYENNPAIVIFYHDQHPSYKKITLNHHSKYSLISNDIIPHTSPTTAQQWAAHYNYPPYSPAPPVIPTIGIISLGGWYQPSDLTHYWTVIQTQPATPTVTSFLIPPNTQPVFGSDVNADVENTLDIEV